MTQLSRKHEAITMHTVCCFMDAILMQSKNIIEDHNSTPYKDLDHMTKDFTPVPYLKSNSFGSPA